MPEPHLSFSFRVIILFLAAGCSFVISQFVYRMTVPPVSVTIRYFLISLRSLGLFLLFLLISEPLLSLITYSVDEPIVSVLIDNSQSMTMTDRAGHRNDVLKSILHSDVWQSLGRRGKIAYSLFDRKIRNLTEFKQDSLTFWGEATDIAGALKEVKQSSASSNLQAVILLTDGNSTVGMNPLYEAEELGVPVFTIGIGDSSEQKDLLIGKVLTNEITYMGTKLPVNVTVHSSGYGGEHVHVSLNDGTTTLDEKSLTLENGARDYLVPLGFIPEKEGTQKFTVEVSQLPNELTERNNRMNFFIKVLKNKMRVALIAGAPSEDVTFIRHILTNDKNAEIKTFIERNDGQFYEGSLQVQTLNDIDCLLLIGFPTTKSALSTLQTVLTAVNAGKPFLFILSRTVEFTKLRLLEPVLPFSVQNISGNESQVFVSIPEVQRNNSILRLANSEKTVEFWSKLPPIFQLQKSFRSKPGSEILATIRFQSATLNDPLIISRNVNKEKSLAVLGYGIWRWQMLSDAGSGTEQLLSDFINNSIRWLTTQEDTKRIHITTSKEIFTSQEAVEFVAQVYNDTYTPIDDAQIEVRAIRHGETNLSTLDPLGNGQYQGTLDRLQEGDYKFEAKVLLGGKEIGSDQGTFSVGGLNAEFLETRMNKPILQQIAERTGGKYYDSDNFSTLAHDVTSLLNFKPRETSKSIGYELWNSRWMLALVVIVFGLEWLMRKRKGML